MLLGVLPGLQLCFTLFKTTLFSPCFPTLGKNFNPSRCFSGPTTQTTALGRGGTGPVVASRAQMGRNGPEQPHLGPPPTPLPQSPFKLRFGCSALPRAMVQGACLQPCLWLCSLHGLWPHAAGSCLPAGPLVCVPPVLLFLSLRWILLHPSS